MSSVAEVHYAVGIVYYLEF